MTAGDSLIGAIIGNCLRKISFDLYYNLQNSFTIGKDS